MRTAFRVLEIVAKLKKSKALSNERAVSQWGTAFFRSKLDLGKPGKTFMLPRAERIGTRDFRRAFENGQVVRARLLQLRFYRRDVTSEKESGQRAAFVVARKTGKATVRNRLKRRLREVYRLNRWRHDARLANTDLLVFAGNAALGASNDDLEKALNELMRRVTQNRSETAKNASRKTVETGDAEKETVVAPRRAFSQALRPVRHFSASVATSSSQTRAARDSLKTQAARDVGSDEKGDAAS